jgi:hypothetical protein
MSGGWENASYHSPGTSWVPVSELRCGINIIPTVQFDQRTAVAGSGGLRETALDPQSTKVLVLSTDTRPHIRFETHQSSCCIVLWCL